MTVVVLFVCFFVFPVQTPDPTFPLTVMAGQNARKRLGEQGWDPGNFGTLVGASGGAKLLGLGHLDRMLFADYLQRTERPLDLYGSSIGSWRHAALAAKNPASAIVTLQDRYLNQAWDENDKRRRNDVIDGLCEWVLDGVLDEETVPHIAQHERFTTHIVTARGIGLNSARNHGAVALGMGLAAMGNLFSRRLLQRSFQRTVFSTGPSRGFSFSDFDTIHIPLQKQNLRAALIASGSIPFLMSGVRDIEGAPLGHYWDGGIIDYHFDFANVAGEDLVLYPHFMNGAIKGWFDKPLPWRKNHANLMDNVVMLAPSRHYLALLPFGKIPDRKDFQRLSQPKRLAYWNEVVARSEQLAEAFTRVIDDDDPLRFVQSFT